MKNLFRKIIFMLALCMSIGGVIPAYATEPETDIFGNPIDWDTNGAGDEDAAGSETESGGSTSETYSFTEQVEVIEQKESIEAQTAAPSETGYVNVSVDTEGLEWSEGSILVTLYRDGNQRHEIWLYRQSGWSTRETLPVGHYTFGKAETSSGEEFSSDIGTFDVIANAPVNLTLTSGTKDPVVVIEDEATDSEAENADVSNNRTSSRIIIVAGVIAIVAILVGLSVMANKRKSKDYRNDIMD